jgi:6-phosphogluconolactonase
MLQEWETGGVHPCHALKHDNQWAFAHYTSGSISLNQEIYSMYGSGPDLDRQNSPHAHMCVAPCHDAPWLAIDLGSDTIWSLGPNQSLTPVWNAPAGMGPRHACWHPNLPILYVNGELDNSFASLAWDGVKFHTIQIETALPQQFHTELRNYPSHIALTLLHKPRIWTAHRNANGICHRNLNDQGQWNTTYFTPTACTFPRHFAISSDETHLAIGGQHNGIVEIFEITEKGITSKHQIQLPNGVFWLGWTESQC